MRVVLLVMKWLLVAVHMLIIIGVVSAFFILPFYTPWYIALPLCIWIVHLVTTRVLPCPFTEMENSLRQRLGERKIGGFIGFYLLKPIKKLLKKWAGKE